MGCGYQDAKDLAPGKHRRIRSGDVDGDAKDLSLAPGDIHFITTNKRSCKVNYKGMWSWEKSIIQFRLLETL